MCSSEAKVILAVVSISSGAAVTRWRRLSDALAAIRGKKVCKTDSDSLHGVKRIRRFIFFLLSSFNAIIQKKSYFVIDKCMERKEKDKSDA